MEHLKLEYENVKGFADLKENKQDLFIQVYKLHNSIQGEDYKKGWTPKSVELIEKEYPMKIILKVIFENEKILYYTDNKLWCSTY